MKAIYLITLIVAVLTVKPVIAQQPASSNKTVSAGTTDTQVIKIHKEYRAAVKQTMSDTKLTEEARWKKVEELIAKKNQQLASILSPEKISKYFPYGGKPGTPGTLVLEKRNIDPVRYARFQESQRNKQQIDLLMSKHGLAKEKAGEVLKIRKVYLESLLALHKDKTLSEEVKQSRKQQFIKKQDQALGKILTPEQLRSLRPERVKSIESSSKAE